jgi:electron transfer flavoprotein alpha/beta subunit
VTLRVFVQVWCEIDPTLNVRVDRATGQPLPEDGDELHRVSPLGRAGVGAAVALPGARVTAFAVGPGHRDALRHALAAGAAQAIELLAEGADPTAVALPALADWLCGRADLVLADRAAGLLAARLGWSHLAGLDELRVRDGVLHAVRLLGRGDRELVTARLPAAVRLHADALRPAYIARARLAAVSEAVIESVALGSATPDPIAVGPLEPARPRVRQGQAVPRSGSGSSRLQALLRPGGARGPQSAAAARPAPQTPEQMAEEFVRYLKHHDLLPW